MTLLPRIWLPNSENLRQRGGGVTPNLIPEIALKCQKPKIVIEISGFQKILTTRPPEIERYRLSKRFSDPLPPQYNLQYESII